MIAEIIGGLATFVKVCVAVKEAVDAATAVVDSVANFVVSVRKLVGSDGRVTSQVVVQIDRDGDGVYEEEDVVYTIYQMFPDFETGYCICDKDGEIGLGLPMYDIIDGREFPYLVTDQELPVLLDDVSLPAIPDDDTSFPAASEPSESAVTFDFKPVTGSDKYYLVEIYNEYKVVTQLGDFTGDGVNDWGVIVDCNGDGLPDASPEAYFYVAGSDEFNALVGVSEDDRALTKPFSHYTVSEALLFLLFVGSFLCILPKLFGRRKLS